MRNTIIMSALALCASILTAVQTVISFISGAGACFNDGCQVVEQLSVLSPLVLNLMGLIFFQAVFWSLYFKDRLTASRVDWPALLLICGLSFDAALMAYQLFAARAFCAYCALIFAVVLLLNLLYSHRQLALALVTAAGIMISFSILTFSPAVAYMPDVSLKNAAYAKKSCSAPSKEVHLIFSADCPHCHTVLDALKNCNSCEFYLNPIEDITALELPGVERSAGFSPQLNRLVLAVLGIDSVPVLVVRNDEGYRFIKGAGGILDYINLACFTQEENTLFEPSFDIGEEAFSPVSEDDGQCPVASDCLDPLP